MDSHGGNVEIISLEEGVAKLRLSGTCKGCASSSVTLELAIKQSIEEQCPDLLDLQVEGVVAPSPAKHSAGAAQKQQPATPQWKAITGLGHLSDNEMQVRDLNGAPIVICKVNGRLFAYRNNCPACEMPLSSLNNEEISCRLGHRYDVLHAGVCTDDKNLHPRTYSIAG